MSGELSRPSAHRPRMPPTPPAPDPMIRTRSRRRIRPLEQIPVWHGFEPGAPAADPSIDGAPAAGSTGVDALLDGLNTEQRRAVTHGEGPLLVVAGAGTGKTQVITRRIAWLIATRRARPSEILALTFTDKAAEEMQLRVDQLVPVRLCRHRDLDLPCFRRPTDPRVRVRARPGTRRARPVAAGGRRLPARAPVRAGPGGVPAARRPDSLPRRADVAVCPMSR